MTVVYCNKTLPRRGAIYHFLLNEFDALLKTDGSYLFYKQTTEMEKGEPVASMITSLNGERWRRVRRMLTTTFTSGRMKEMIVIFPIIFASPCMDSNTNPLGWRKGCNSCLFVFSPSQV